VSSTGHGVSFRPNERRGELMCLPAFVRGLGRTAPVHPTLFLMWILRYGPSWPQVTLTHAHLFPSVRVLTQAHMPGPRVVGGDMGPRRARQSPRPFGVGRDGARDPWGRTRRSMHPRVGRDGARGLERDPCSLEVGWDGNCVLGVWRDRARTQGVGRDIIICLALSGGVSVSANSLALGIPNIDTRRQPFSFTIV